MELVVMGVDPGMHTGVAWAKGSYWEHDGWSDWWRYANKGSCTIEVPSLRHDHLHELAMLWMQQCVMPLWNGATSFMLIVEGFTLGTYNQSRSPTLLSPVQIGTLFKHEFYSLARMQAIDAKAEQVMAVLWGIQEYSAGQSKGSVTDERLKAYNVWIPGRDHERDAYRLIIHALKSKWNEITPV